MAEKNPQQQPGRPHWLVRPDTIRRLCMGGGLLLAVLVLLDAVIEHHSYFDVDGTFGFYAWFGFGTSVAMIVFSKVLGIFVKRPDTYYDD